MKMKTVVALACVAGACVAGAADYVAYARNCRNPINVVNAMTRDPALKDPAALRAALEGVDRAMVTGKVAVVHWFLSRKCPLTVQATIEHLGGLTPKMRGDILAVCGYDAENLPIGLRPGETGCLNALLLKAGSGERPAAEIRGTILNAALVPARRYVRAHGETFVGKDGAKRVKAHLDALAAELNKPRLGKANEVLAALGVEVEWETVQGRLLGDREVSEVRTKLMNGDIPFSAALQSKLCVALGVEGYNAFVREYNGN